MEAVLNKEVISSRVLCKALSLIVFVILTGLGAFVRIPLPFTPVPITLQTFFVLLSGALLGARLGSLAQLSYLSLGILGLPIFTSAGSGLLYATGPTGGYLFGFLLAAFFAGKVLADNKRSFIFVFFTLCLADFILLTCGIIWLRFLFGYPFNKLFYLGFLPFISGDLIKAFLAAIVYSKARARFSAIL